VNVQYSFGKNLFRTKSVPSPVWSRYPPRSNQYLCSLTARSREDEARRNANRNSEWFAHFSQLVKMEKNQISRYLAVQIRFEILVELFICISRYKFESRFLFNLNLKLTKISPPFRILICIPTSISSPAQEWRNRTVAEHACSKIKRYVSPKQNGFNNKIQWYSMLVTFVFKFMARLLWTKNFVLSNLSN